MNMTVVIFQFMKKTKMQAHHPVELQGAHQKFFVFVLECQGFWLLLLTPQRLQECLPPGVFYHDQDPGHG